MSAEGFGVGVTTQHRDRVAEAIWEADRPEWASPKSWLWAEVNDTHRRVYRRMADAAIAAMGLEQEWGALHDGSSISFTGSYRTQSAAQDRVDFENQGYRARGTDLELHLHSRFVSPWVGEQR